ncbi:MAG: hypothetical protein SYC29_17820, partial [Planctomycetota bacterium]|nr:hypothetical protein [Planctomycetota bacterium]
MRGALVQPGPTGGLPRLDAAAVIVALVLFSMIGCDGTGSSAGSEQTPAPDVAESSAERGPVRFTARAAPGAITVGDKLTLTLEVEAPEAVDIEMPQLAEELGPFEIRAARTPPDVPDGDLRRWTHQYTLDTFASGELEIPALEVGFVDRRPDSVQDGEPVEGTLSSEPLSITVRSVLKGDELAGDYRDIQDAVEVPIPIDWR